MRCTLHLFMPQLQKSGRPWVLASHQCEMQNLFPALIAFLQTCLIGAYRDAAFFPQILGTVRIMTPVAIWAISKLHELVTQPCLEEELTAAGLPIS